MFLNVFSLFLVFFFFLFLFLFFNSCVCRLFFLLIKRIKRYHCQVLEHAYDSEARYCHVVKMPVQGLVGKQGEHLKSGRSRQTVSLVRHQGPTTISKVERIKFCTPVLTCREPVNTSEPRQSSIGKETRCND